MSDKTTSKNVNEEKGGYRKLLFVIGLIIILLLLIFIILILWSRGKGAQSEGAEQEIFIENGARSVIVSSENADEIIAQMESAEPVKPGYYTVAMTNGWHFENSTAVSYDAYVKNLPENSHNVYFDLFLEDDKENPIYQSPVISLGAELDKISLIRELPKGEYKCIMVYHLVDENQETVDTLRVVQTVIIEN